MKRCFQRFDHPQRLLIWWFGVTLMWLFVGTLSVPAKAQPRLKETYPRLMGMNIGQKNYDDPQYQHELARLDVVILGFHPYWKPRGSGKEPIRDVVKQIKKLNPNILVGQYTVLNEAYDNLGPNIADKDKYFKLYKEGWWLTDANGHKVQWTPQFNTWEVNFTKWAPLDSEGKRWPEWLAERDFRLFFSRVPEFDIWYFDNVLAVQRIKWADWDREDKDERGDDPRVAQACREGHLLEWRTARRLAPQLMQLGNADNDLSSPEFKGQLEGAFLEGAMGWTWSLEKQVGWQKMMKRYRDLMANTAPPHMVGFNVAGAPDDYRLFRYGFASCLLDDGYFSYSDKEKGASTVPWFDEYDIDLGRAIDPPIVNPWQKGVYRRLFEKGMVLVNPSESAATVTVEPGYRAIVGKQDPKVNHGKPVIAVTIGPKDGIVLVKQ